MNPALSIVIPTHNRSSLLGRVLQGYEEQEGDAPFELLVVDDGSIDDTPSLLRQLRPGRFLLRPVILAQNGGPGQARNAALKAAAAPLVLIAGDDILPSADFVARHLEGHDRAPEPHWAILGLTSWATDLHVNSLMRHIDGRGGQQFGYAHLRDGQEVDFRHFYTSNVSLKKAVFDRLDRWFDPDFTFPAYEDAELAYRLTRRCGLRIRFLASARATHHHPYDLRSFANRQYHCGLMASVMFRKHPELRARWRVGRLKQVAVVASLPPFRGFLDSLQDEEIQGAEELAFCVGTACEKLYGAVVDALYAALLEYFNLKGMLVGELGPDRAQRPGRALLLFGLLQRLCRLMDGPGGYVLADLESGKALARAARKYEEVRRGWPRPLRWLGLGPARAMIPQP